MKYESQLRDLFTRVRHRIRSKDRAVPEPRVDEPSAAIDQVLTRDCLDPWNYVEVSAEGMVKPCCMQPPIEEILTAEPERNSGAFRDLRNSLLTGALTPSCKTCHIRSMVSTTVLRRKIQALSGERGANIDLSEPAMLKQIRIDISQACNLRCVYCAVSQPDYAGVHMSEAVFDKALALIPKGKHGVEVDLNGHGETTFHPQWMDFTKKVQETGAITMLLSNFAKSFTDAEVKVLAHVNLIQISLDTVDGDSLRDIRRKVSLPTIVENISRIKAYAKAHGLAPTWSISCGIYDKNVHSLGDLAAFAVKNGFKTVTFWNLVEHPTPPNTNVEVRALASLPGEERDRAVSYATSIVEYLRRCGLVVDVAGEFLNRPADVCQDVAH